MVSGQDLYLELERLSKRLNELIDGLLEYGKARDRTESEYRQGLTKAILKQQADGQKATLILDIVRGLPEVDSLRYARDIAQTYYNHCQESINVCKILIKVMESQISREWGRQEDI